MYSQSAAKAPALVPAYGELPPTFWEQHHAAIIVAGLGLLAFVIFLIVMLLRPETPVIVPPETVARQALARLQGRPEDGKVLSEISQILRRYVCAAFGLPFVEMTSSEFYLVLGYGGKIDLELGESISRFLRECDERKFSPTGSAAGFNAIPRALELISLSQRRLSQTSPAPGGLQK